MRIKARGYRYPLNVADLWEMGIKEPVRDAALANKHVPSTAEDVEYQKEWRGAWRRNPSGTVKMATFTDTIAFEGYKLSSLCKGCQYYVNGKRVGQLVCLSCPTLKEAYLEEWWH